MIITQKVILNLKRTLMLSLLLEEMFQQTDTRWAPWKVVDGNNKKAARIAALTHIVEVLEAAVPMTPPDLDPAVAKLAYKAFGYAPKD